MNAVFPGERLIFENIDDQHMGFPSILLLDLLQDGANLPAGNAFVGPEIHQDWLAALQGFFEIFARIRGRLGNDLSLKSLFVAPWPP